MSWRRRRVQVSTVEEEGLFAYRLEDEDASPVGCGLFATRDWAVEYARGRGWRLVDEPIRVDLVPGRDR